MNGGVMIVGLNGAGKTTLGRALADAMGFFRMDVEDYYFLPSENPYAVSRTKDEVRRLMFADIQRHERFVLSSVNGNWGDAIVSRVAAVIMLQAPREMRLARIDRRSSERFGRRVEPGGDMFEQERRFRDIAAARSEGPIEDWIGTLSVPVLRLDARRPVAESLTAVVDWLNTLD